ncbi:MAG: type II secretion system GspH family protein [Patescibacteria group bacterium]|nr:type II secretion system GspH family protein [Patescibacteria group bacterium]
MKKGFTLIELLVVIAILAVLMSVIVVTLNPAEMLKKTRDTKRIADLDALRTAINLYITDVGSPSMGSPGVCYASQAGATSSGITCSSVTASTNQNVTGTGWIPINFTSISSGSPLSSLPLDPRNVTTTSATTSYVYYYKTNTSSTTYELLCNMESTYYANGGSGNVESTDGGDDADLYEVGSDLTLM